MNWLQDIGIQRKLLGIFAVILVAGIAALAWNIANINGARDDVTDALEASQGDVRTVLSTNKDDVTQVLDTSSNDVARLLEQMDGLLLLQIIEIEFRQLETLEKEILLYSDPGTVDVIKADFERINADLERHLDLAESRLTDERLLGLLPGLKAAREDQAALFSELADVVNDDFFAALDQSTAASNARIDAVYGVLASSVSADWNATFDEFDQTWARVQTAIDDTETGMQEAMDDTESSLDGAIDSTDSNLQSAINISVLTIVLFVVAGVIVAATVAVVSRQIVRPVLVMSDVAESIENEEFRTENLDSLIQRQDEIGLLARVFQRMAKEVHTRVEKLKQQVRQLQIVIDDKRVSEEVSQITETDYFRDLQAKAKQLRDRPLGKETGGAAGSPPDEA